jgi:hypothetical protein
LVFSDMLRGRLKKQWVLSRGVQRWVLDSARVGLAGSLRKTAECLAPESREITSSDPAGLPFPRDAEGLRVLITHLREVLARLDDVADYVAIGDIDDDMYRLWKELERKMQLHRQSEAKFQLQDMFRI